MAYFKIGTTDFSSVVSGLKIGYEVLLSEDSGRNASGNLVFDIVNRKKKIYVTTKPMTDTEMSNFLTAVEDFIVYVTYRDPQTKALKSNVKCYIGTPEPEYMFLQANKIIYKPLSLNFIEV